MRLEQLAAETEYQMYVRAVSQDGPGETSQTIAITTGKPRCTLDAYNYYYVIEPDMFLCMNIYRGITIFF